MADHESQHTSSSSGAAQPVDSALPANTAELTVGFYNVGPSWVSEPGDPGWQRKERRLKSDFAKAFEVHALDVLCLSDLNEHVPGGDVDSWIRELLPDRAGPPARVHAARDYATIVMSDRVEVLQCKLVSDFVPDQADRCFQHFRVRVGDDSEPVSIVNCHAPASKKLGLTMDVRMRTFLACNEACAGDRFIWGGHFNTAVILLSALVQSIDDSYTIDSSVAQPGSLQLVFSRPSNFKHGDFAMINRLRSVQTNSEVGASFDGASPAHDLVVAKVFGLGASRPAQEKAQPPLTRPAPRSPPRSAAQPATVAGMILKPATPRVNAISGSDAPAETALQEVLEKLGRDFMSGEVANINASNITEKLEEFLRVVEVQRANHLRRMPGLRADAIFTELHMKDIHNEWMSHHNSWMNAATTQKYNDLREGLRKGDHQRAHKLQRQAFSAYLFQVMGNKHVLLDCIQHAICSVAQPAEAMRQFIDRWTQEKPSKRIATVNEDPPPQSSHGRRTRPKWTTR